MTTGSSESASRSVPDGAGAARPAAARGDGGRPGEDLEVRARDSSIIAILAHTFPYCFVFFNTFHVVHSFL